MSNQSKGRHEEATWLGAINQHRNKLIVEAPKSGKEFAKNQNLKKSIGVGFALNKCDLGFIGQQQRGIDDARNIARLLPWCIDTRKIQ